MSKQHEAGQTLVALLIFMMLVITLATVAATITIVNIRSNSSFASGEQALANADSGAENALQRLLRDPTYTGETVSFANGAATISVTGTTGKTITSVGSIDNYQRTVTVTADYINNVLTVTSWSETP